MGERAGPSPPGRHPPRTLDLAPAIWWRVHPWDPATGRFVATAFNDHAGADARFSPLSDGEGRVVGTLYAASTLHGALMETVRRDVPFGR